MPDITGFRRVVSATPDRVDIISMSKLAGGVDSCSIGVYLKVGWVYLT